MFAGTNVAPVPTGRIRDRNTVVYRVAHWPIWIWVFFVAPGPLMFDLFERGFDVRIGLWLAVVIAGTGAAGLRGRLPGVEPRPYIIRFTEDNPNPFYRRVCYTFAWSMLISFAALNVAGLTWAVATGEWRLKQMYQYGYWSVAGAVCLAGALGRLPRVTPSTKSDGVERRYFYGAAWAICVSHPVLWALWKFLPRSREADAAKLIVYVALLAGIGALAVFGRLPRTRPVAG